MALKDNGFEVFEDRNSEDVKDLSGETGGRWEISGLGGNDIITGGNGINVIYGDSEYPLNIDGLDEKEYKRIMELYSRYSGDDVIKGGNGVNIIHAGRGNDEITGGAGVNVIQFKTGDGSDVICNGKGEDYLYFCDWGYDNAHFSRSGDDLVITYCDPANNNELKPDLGEVTLKDYFKHGTGSSIKAIGFGLGDVGKYSVDLEPVSSMLQYDDVMTTESLAAKIKEAFKTSASMQKILKDAGLSIEIEKPGEITGSDGGDKITGSAGGDVINGGAGNDVIEGGKGDDILYGGSGENTFIFYPGDGKDTLYHQGGVDILDFTKAQNTAGAIDIIGVKEKNDLIVRYSAQGSKNADEIRIVNYFKGKTRPNVWIKVNETVENGTNAEILKNVQDFIYVENDFSNEIKGKKITGTILNDLIKGSAKNDTIKGGNGNDIIYGNKGNDRLYGQAGKNTFVFKKGDGNDTVYSGKGEDTIKFEDIEAIETNGVKNVKFSAKGKNLILNYGNGDTVTISRYLSNPAKSSIKFIQFGNNAPEAISDLLNKYPFEFDGVLNKRNSQIGRASCRERV